MNTIQTNRDAKLRNVEKHLYRKLASGLITAALLVAAVYFILVYENLQLDFFGLQYAILAEQNAEYALDLPFREFVQLENVSDQLLAQADDPAALMLYKSRLLHLYNQYSAARWMYDAFVYLLGFGALICFIGTVTMCARREQIEMDAYDNTMKELGYTLNDEHIYVLN